MADNQNFTQVANRIPTSIGRITYAIKSVDDGSNPPSMGFAVRVLDQNGDQLKVVRGDMRTYMTNTQESQLDNFVSNRRAAIPDDYFTGLSIPVDHQVGTTHWRLIDNNTANDDTNANRQIGIAYFVELDENGQFVQRRERLNEAPHLSNGQINGIRDFMQEYRQKAINQLLPGA